MKIIFLDFDGVLIPYNFMYLNTITRRLEAANKNLHFADMLLKTKTMDQYGRLFESNSVGYLNLIIQKTNAKIVIISDWRRGGLDLLKQMWEYRQLPGEIIDITDINHKSRTEQINDYLNDHNDIDNYVIIDDEPSLYIPQPHRVFIDSYIGIGKKEYLKTLDILNK